MEIWLVVCSGWDGYEKVWGFTREDDARRFAAAKDKSDLDHSYEALPLRLDSQEYV